MFKCRYSECNPGLEQDYLKYPSSETKNLKRFFFKLHIILDIPKNLNVKILFFNEWQLAS